LAERAGLSSDAIPGAMYSHLLRVVDVLDGEGARFTGDKGVSCPASIAGSTIIHSEAVA
jgi:hypothetical protein